MNVDREINRRYVPPRPAASDSAATAAVQPTDTGRTRRLRRGLPSWLHESAGVRRTLSVGLTNLLRVAFIPVLLALALAVRVMLQLYLRGRPFTHSALHRQAIASVGLFTRQYPLHLYPIVCKALELAVLQDELRDVSERRQRVVEIAIGDGTLSRRVFPPGAEVVGLELNPYYLRHARAMDHVQDAIVSDCLEPPLADGTFDVLVANNFLHHVTQKTKTLSAWAKIAGKAIFNENTPYWASSWVVPYGLAKLGLRSASIRAWRRIERTHWQALVDLERLHAVVGEHYEIQRATSYLSERTFVLCALFSFVMRCTGPPTPPVLKKLFLGPLRRMVLPLTEELAALLIRFDQYQDRAKDAYVSYVGRSRSFRRADSRAYLACPKCRQPLELTKCLPCGVAYERVDGMVFLLPDEMSHIRETYKAVGLTTSDAELL